jgi:hypothetical protein
VQAEAAEKLRDMVLEDAKRADAYVALSMLAPFLQIPILTSLSSPDRRLRNRMVHFPANPLYSSFVDSVEDDAEAATGPLNGAFGN